MQNKLEIFDELYEGLKFKDAVYTEKTNTCTVNFLYNPENFQPTEENKTNINEKLNSIIGDFVKYELNFISCPLDKRAIANYVYSTIKNLFPSLSTSFEFNDIKVEIEKLNVIISLQLTKSAYDYALEFNREVLIAEKLKESFLADFIIKFEEKKIENQPTSFIEKNMELMSSVKELENKTIFELSEITNIIGTNNNKIAVDFSKISSPVANIVVCGEVTSIQKASYTRKFTKNGEEKEIEHKYYRFSIKNDGKVLYCVIFPKQAEEQKGDVIEVGMHVCCFGSFKKDRNDRLSFTADTIARCVYTKEEKQAGFKKVNEDYHTVFPQEFIDYEQSGMFDEEKTFPGTYVVFDLETTGFDSVKDEIIEVGACKVENGVITELFSTFVKPTKHIPREITELTSITDDMVKDAPTINYVLPDFYKFCYGATLVGHNVAFDIGFIYSAAKKLNYNFDNPLKDTLEMAREKLPGLKNYKLGTVVQKLNIVLENAHRAVNDATATAKVFVKLM